MIGIRQQEGTVIKRAREIRKGREDIHRKPKQDRKKKHKKEEETMLRKAEEKRQAQKAKREEYEMEKVR